MTAVEAGYDLSGLMLCLLAIGLLLAVKGLAKAVFGLIDIALPIIGHPFHGIVTSVEHAAIGALNDAIKGTEKLAAKFFNGMIDSLGILVGLAVLLGEGTKLALTYMWNHALRPLIRLYTDPIGTLARAASALVSELTRTVAGNVTRAERYADAAASRALTDARTYAGAVALTAEHAAERYADDAVAALRSAEDEALSRAIALANAAETDAATAFAKAQAYADSLVAPVGADLTALEQYVKSLGVPALLASVPALGLLLTQVLTETGLENAECRGKVKQVCGTDPAAWSNLLAGLAAVGFAFSLPELYKVARPLVDDLAPVIREAA